MGTSTYVPNIIQSVEFGRKAPKDAENRLFMMAARGSVQNEFEKASYKRSEYFRLPTRDSNQRVHNECKRADSHSRLKVKYSVK